MLRLIRIAPAILLLFSLSGIADAQSAKPVRTGKHLLSLQWLQGYGAIIVSAPDAQGWQQVKGQQHNKNGELTVDGKLKASASRELIFEGTIRSQANGLNGDQVCERQGPFHFLSTGTRKYWRLQEMENCGGGGVVDYVDIYF